MRILLLVLVSAFAIFAEDPPATTPAGQAPDNLSIPAQLGKTVDTKKCKAGDVVELRTLEPVLIANGAGHAGAHQASRQNRGRSLASER